MRTLKIPEFPLVRINHKNVRKHINWQKSKVALELERLGNPKTLVIKTQSFIYLISPQIGGDQLRVTTYEHDGWPMGHEHYKSINDILIKKVGRGNHEILDDVPLPPNVEGTNEELIEKYWDESIPKEERKHIGLELRLMRYVDIKTIFAAQPRKSA